MTGLDDLINQITAAVKYKQKDSSDSAVYHDEPILKTAKQLSNYLPPEIVKMKKIAVSEQSYNQTAEYIFYKQAKFMENFEDDFEYHGEFNRYFPTYQSMNNSQLRGYFSWRTKVRHGVTEKTSASFAFVYIYELINMIGVTNAEEGFRNLLNFWQTYREFDQRLDFYMKTWLSDYIVYYNLDPSLLCEFSDTHFDSSLIVLLDHKTSDDVQIFEALNSLSSYNIENSKFCRQYPDETRAVVSSVYRELCDYYENNRKRSLCEKLFGNQSYSPYYMFGSAVFYDRMKYLDYTYKINDIYSFRCRNGNWICDRYYIRKGKSKEIGSLLKAIDYWLRDKFSFRYPLKPENTTKTAEMIIDRAIQQLIDSRKKSAVQEIKIDVSKLQKIRNSADIIRDKLITDEETAEESQQEKNETPEVPHTEETENCILDEKEYKFLHAMLYNEDYAAVLKAEGVMLSIAVDSVNEKLFDMFSDTVIIFDGDEPVLVEDYIGQLKGMVVE